MQGLLFVWIGCLVVTAFGDKAWAQEAFRQINDNALLTFIYDNNGDIDEAVDILKRVESLVDDGTAGDYYVALRQLYGDAGMNEKAEFYNQKVLELIPKDTRPVEELTKSAEMQE